MDYERPNEMKLRWVFPAVDTLGQPDPRHRPCTHPLPAANAEVSPAKISWDLVQINKTIQLTHRLRSENTYLLSYAAEVVSSSSIVTIGNEYRERPKFEETLIYAVYQLLSLIF